MVYLLNGLALMTIVITKVYADNDDDPCLPLLDLEEYDKMCCNSLEALDKFEDGSEECMKDVDSEEWKCEDFQCLLRNNKMLKDDKVDENGAKIFFDKLKNFVPNEKAVIDKVRNECLNGKYEVYPPPVYNCPAIRFYVCIYTNVLMGCTSWKTDETCSKLAEDAEKCRASLESK